MLTITTLPNGDVQVECQLDASADASLLNGPGRTSPSTIARVFRAIGNAVYLIHPSGHLVRARANPDGTGKRLTLSGSLADTLRAALKVPPAAPGLTLHERQLLGLQSKAGQPDGSGD